MKTMKRFLSMAALALAGAIITACSGSDDGIDTPPQPENTGKVVTLKTTVGFDDGSATTRALTSGGVKTFAVGETMALVYESMSDQRTVKESEPLTPGDIAEGGKSATFTFRLTEEPDKTESVYYIYPAAMAMADGNENYEALSTEQDGTLAKLASNFDLATAYNLDWVNGNLPGATLANQLAVLAITLKDDATDADITGSITGLTLTARNYSHTESMTYNITRSAVAGPIYVAIHPTMNATIDVTATGGGYTYTKTLTYKVYKASKGYNVSWRMTDVTPPNAVPLTMEALTDGTIVVDKPRSGMQYSKNGGAKAAVSSVGGTIPVSKDDKVQFYGNSAVYYLDGSSEYTSIAGGTAEVKVYGNIMSLVDETGYADATTLTANNTFRRLFDGNTKLKDASRLLLPATTLKSYCYYDMFKGCTSLTAAPALPATTLAQYCYQAMFYGCTSLTAAPALPATTLAKNCYSNMFAGCSSLTAAPALPAKKLEFNCYTSMFNGCTSLTDAPALPVETLAKNCYSNMFAGCTSLETAPALPATTLADGCYTGMFNGCTKLNAVTCLATDISATGCTLFWLKDAGTQVTFQGCTNLKTAPALPAKTLAPNCYGSMFFECTSLTDAPAELPATTLAEACYGSMFYRCSSLETAPVLPATTLVTVCYMGMFSGCTNLSAVTCLATDIRAIDCTSDWLDGVAATGTFTKNPLMEDWETNDEEIYYGIPSGWTIVDAQ